MKVLLTIHQYFPEYSSGTEVLTRLVAHELTVRGHDVCILTGHPVEQASDRKELFDEYDYDGVHVWRFYYRSVALLGRQASQVDLRNDNIYAVQCFEKILDDFRPDVIHFFHLDRLGSGLIESAVQKGIPAFMTPTDFWAICPTGQLLLSDGELCLGPNSCSGNCVKHVAAVTQGGLLGSVMLRIPTLLFDLISRLSRFAFVPRYPHDMDVKAIGSWVEVNVKRLNKLNKIFSPNCFMTEKLIQNGVFPHLLIQSSFGVEKTHALGGRIRSSLSLPLTVGYIGTLAEHKGCHVLLNAFKKIPEGSATLKIYGKLDDFPDYLCMLKGLAADDDLIEFCGEFPLPSLASVLDGIDVLVVPSVWYENTPLIVYSAQEACCPVVASNLPGISEVIQNEVNGLLFTSGSSDALGVALGRLIREQGLLQRLSSHAMPPKSISCYVDELLGAWDGV